jgi:signal transduction histidine kinase
MFFDPEQGWRGVAGLLVAGIGHDLNGRLTALMGIAHVARHTGADPELLDVLDDQVKRLEQSIRALRAWPVGGPGNPELTRIKDVLPPMLELYECRGGGDDVALTVEEGPSNAIRIRIRPFMEALLLLLAAAEHASDGRHRPLDVRYGSEGGEAWLAIRAKAGNATSASVDSLAVAEARTLLESAGARLARADAGGEGVHLEIRTPEAV